MITGKPGYKYPFYKIMEEQQKSENNYSKEGEV